MLTRERWTHWVFVKDADADKGHMRIYANGALLHQHKTEVDPAAKNSPPVLLKQSIAGITDARLFANRPKPGWTGQIAELRIWNFALGEREIEANSVLTLSICPVSTAAVWP